MADKALRGNKLTKELKALSTGIRKIGKGLDRGKFKKKGYRVDESISPVAKSRVIDRMKEEAKALGGSFFTAEEMEAKIKKEKNND